jgi:hypothetical protein
MLKNSEKDPIHITSDELYLLASPAHSLTNEQQTQRHELLITQGLYRSKNDVPELRRVIYDEERFGYISNEAEDFILPEKQSDTNVDA